MNPSSTPSRSVPPTAATAPTGAPPLRPLLQRVALPALATLGVTLARVFGELGSLPDWLVNRAAGGGGALLGISWLPPLLGWWFAREIAGKSERPKRELAKTLIVYGFLARLPVFALTWIAEVRGWEGTHLTKYGPDGPESYPATLAGRLGAAAAAQLGFWVFAWTLGSGMLVGWLYLRNRAKQAAAAA